MDSIETSSTLTKLRALRKSHLATNHGITFYNYQEAISDRILAAMVANFAVNESASEAEVKLLEPLEIVIEISRQAGKTSAIVYTVEFIMIWFPVIFQRPVSIGIFAPLQRQYKIDFDRLKQALRKTRKDLVEINSEGAWRVHEEENARTLVLENGARCLVYPVSVTSSPEGETLDLIIVEEAQGMVGEKERILTQGVFPMGAATNAPRVFIGTAGTQVCYFYRKINSQGAMVLDCDLVIKDRRKVYEQTKNANHLKYEQFIKSEEKRLGRDHDDFKRPYLLVWLLELGMFVTQNQWENCRILQAFDPGDMSAEHFWGLDTAKEADQTVLKIGREIDGRLVCVFSTGFRGVNYKDQFDIICAVLQRFKVATGAVDSTGQGDFMPDLFERGTSYKVERVKFSLMSKDVIYKSLYDKIINDKFRFYDDGSNHSRECDNEMLGLVKEYKQAAGYLSVHHPDDKDAHDDHSDALALMSFAYDQYNKGSGITDFYKSQLREVPQVVPKGEYRYGLD